MVQVRRRVNEHHYLMGITDTARCRQAKQTTTKILHVLTSQRSNPTTPPRDTKALVTRETLPVSEISIGGSLDGGLWYCPGAWPGTLSGDLLRSTRYLVAATGYLIPVVLYQVQGTWAYVFGASTEHLAFVQSDFLLISPLLNLI